MNLLGRLLERLGILASRHPDQVGFDPCCLDDGALITIQCTACGHKHRRREVITMRCGDCKAVVTARVIRAETRSSEGEGDELDRDR